MNRLAIPGIGFKGGQPGSMLSNGLMTHRALSQDMRIDHGRAYIRLTEELLHGADVIAIFKQVGGEAVPKCVAASRLRYRCLENGDLHMFVEE